MATSLDLTITVDGRRIAVRIRFPAGRSVALIGRVEEVAREP